MLFERLSKAQGSLVLWTVFLQIFGLGYNTRGFGSGYSEEIHSLTNPQKWVLDVAYGWLHVFKYRLAYKV